VKTKDLVRMANQIAAFFKAYPEEEAVSEIAKHLKSFWDPRMLSSLIQSVESKTGVSDLDPLVLASVRKLKT